MSSSHTTRLQAEDSFAVHELFLHNCIFVKNRIVDPAASKLKALSPGGAYGHEIEFVRNYALWPLEVSAVNTLANLGQLEYRPPAEPSQWAFTAELLPNRGGRQAAILECVSRGSGRDLIKTTLTSNAGIADEMILELEIE